MPSPDGHLRGHHYDCPYYHDPAHARDNSCAFSKCEMPPGEFPKPIYTVQISGCDASTAVAMELNTEQLALLKLLHDKCNGRPYPCGPSVMVYQGDVCEYELDEDENWDPIPGTGKWTGRIDMMNTLLPMDGFNES